MAPKNTKPVPQHILDTNPASENKTPHERTNRLARIRYTINKYYELNLNLIQEKSQASSSIQLDNEQFDDEFEEFDNEEFDPNQISIY
ncbi:8292_t:CDS:2 [Cetraspora pellucida]|uniref:8292_t:CDS:1 n=1 Tax=Cetraspora pellucida TaxID=1433469 RepID=A0A9N9PAV4_9GLOM|nr:8292_t:CDS:2 [Cetraspora pellucida]